MKKSKLTALIISAAMAMQTMPVFTGIASAATGMIPNELNFEDVQLGTSADTLQGIVLDKGTATVEKDEYGSNAVKISSGAILKFNLDSSMDSNHTVIEYKYRSVNHESNAQLYEFGTLVGQNEQRILKSRIYNQHLNICKGTSTDENNNFNISNALSASESYVTMKYVVKHEDKQVDVYKDGELVKSNIPYFHSVNSAPVILLFNIAFSTASTFYIDDISIKKVAKTSSGWDFENESDVTDISGITASGTTAIEEDETTGNKYLAASPSSTVKFNFPATTGDLVKISYTMTLPEALTADASHTNDFGSVRSGTTRALRTSRAFTGWVYYIRNANDGGVAKKMPAGTYNVEYTLNMNTKTTSVKLNGSDINVQAYSSFPFMDTTLTSVDNIYFVMGKNTVYFDDISVKEYSSTANEWTFEDITSMEELPSVTITGTNEIAEVDGDNALMLKGQNNVTFNAPTTTKGKVTVEYDYKTVTKGTSTSDQILFGAVRNGTSQAVRAIDFDSKIIVYHGINYPTNIGRMASNETEWTNVKYVIDFNNKRFEVYKNGEGVVNATGQNRWGFYASNSSLNNIFFNNQEGQVIYIDNIKITEDTETPLNPTVTSATIENNSIEIKLDTEFAVSFSKAVTIDEGDVTVTANGEAIEATTTLSDDGLTATIAFDKAYDTEYTVTLDGVQSADGGTLAKYTNTFTTEAPYVSVKNTTIKDGAKGVYTGTELKVTFNKPVSAVEASVNANGEDVGATTALSDDGMTAVINFSKACDTTYVVTISKASGGDETELESAYTLSFTTEDSYTVSDISVSNSVTDKQIEVEASIANNGVAAGLNYNLYVAIYDENDALESVKSTDGTLAVGKADFVSLTMDKPQNYTQNHKVKVFVWDDGMKPLTGDAEQQLPQARTYGYDNYVSEEITTLNVAFLGGSITEQTAPQGYSDYVVNNFDWNGKEVNRANRVNNGVGGTTSELGMYRVSKDIISSKPDVVFIDYAVNDCVVPTSEQSGETMENIIRQLMKLDHQPMIILAHMPTKTQGELTKTIPAFNALAEKYGIGYINVAQYVADEVTKGTYTWDTATGTSETLISGDGTHPNTLGATVYGQYIVEQLTNSSTSYFKKMTQLETPQYSALNFRNPKLVPYTAAQYTGSWYDSTVHNNRLQAGNAMAQKKGDSVTYKFVGSAVGIYMLCNSTGAKAEYSVDNGAVTGTIDAYLGATMPQYKRLAAGLDYGVHTVTITLTEDGSFGIGYFCED